MLPDLQARPCPTRGRVAVGLQALQAARPLFRDDLHPPCATVSLPAVMAMAESQQLTDTVQATQQET